MKNNINEFVMANLKGIGQIMLQENYITGALFLLGIFLNSVPMGIAAIIGVCSGTFSAQLLKLDSQKINAGLYGFNAALVGVSLIFYFEDYFWIWLLIFPLSFLATLMFEFFSKKNIPIFTFPFILIIWICIFLLQEKTIHTEPDATDYFDEIIKNSFSIFNHGLGFGEVIFQGSLISGVIFLIAVYINSPIAALYGVFGVALSVLIVIFYQEKIDSVKDGLFGFNALLCAITFSGTRKIDGVFVCIAVFLSVLIESIMLDWDLIILTFPFVFASWLVLVLKKVTKVNVVN